MDDDTFGPLGGPCITGQMLREESLEISPPPKSPEAVNVKYINKDHYTGMQMVWEEVLDSIFLYTEYASKIVCSKNFDFFLERGLLKFEVSDQTDDEGQGYVEIFIDFWSPLEQRYVSLDEMSEESASVLMGIVGYYGSVN